MKLFTKIRNTFVRRPRTLTTLAVVAGVLISIPLAAVLAEFYPDRPVFDYNVESQRVGSLDGPVFNSFINTPSYGDERAFLDARRSDQTAAGSFKNVLADVDKGSQEVVLRTYIHNNANQSTNGTNFDGPGVAKNTKVRIFLPTATGQALRARSYISADNASPNLVEDTVDLTAGQEFSVEYIPGSATLYNNGPFANSTQLNDSIVTTGAPIGHNALDGKVPGCFEFEAVVQIRVKVKVKKNPDIQLVKEVRKKGESEWKKEVSAKPGETVEWLLTTDNTGKADLLNVVVRDVLPPHVKLVNGSVKWIDATQNATQGDKPLFDGGINVGGYGPGSGFYMMFATTTEGNFEPCQVRVRNLAYARSDQTPDEINDSADITITRENCQPPKVPEVRCDALELTKLDGRKVRLNVRYTATNGAKFKNVKYDFGDGSTPLLTDKTTVEYTYAKDGNFVARATLTFSMNGQDKVVDSDTCAKPVSFTTPTPQVLTVKTTELPKTGAGDVLGIFAATTIAGALAHKLVWIRFRG